MNKKRNKRKKRFYQRKGLWIFLFVCLLVGAIGIFGVWEFKLKEYYERSLTYDMEKVGAVELPSQIFDRNGIEIGRTFEENRSLVTVDKVPKAFINALMAQEDQRFYQHHGVDWVGVARAFYLNWKARETTQGASTITMQLARNAFNLQKEADEREESGMDRKIVEAFVALQIEKHYVGEVSGIERERKKAKLLEMYVNRVHFGKGYYGIRAASLGFFGKEPEDLSLTECASLVCCIKNPYDINPIRTPDRNKKERNHVFNRMLAEGTITSEEHSLLTERDVVVNPKPIQRGTSHLYGIVVEKVRDIVGDDAMSRGGFSIFTTIDASVQEEAEESLREHLLSIERQNGYRHPLYADYRRDSGKPPEYLQGAVLVTDSRTGAVIAHVGGRQYSHSQYDFIESGRRPLGTAFLPIVYAAAFERGRNPATVLDDLPMDAREVALGGSEGILGEWGSEILDPVYEGPITARTALRQSKIAATVRLGVDVGLASVSTTAKKFGLPLESGELLPRLLLGWEQAALWPACRAYSAFAGGGRAPESTYYIESIRDSEGLIIHNSQQSNPERSEFCDSATAYQIHSILSDTTSSGNLTETGQTLYDPRHTVLKSSTNHNFSDGWAIGYNGNVTCGVWIGFLEGRKPIHDFAFGKKLAVPIWTRTMNVANASFPGKSIQRPSTLVTVALCSRSGRKVTRYCYDSVFDPDHGVSLASTAYPEHLRLDQEDIGLCDVHGAGGVTPSLEYGPDTNDARQRKLAISPIKVTTNPLLGEDPYQSVVVSTPEASLSDEDAQSEDEEQTEPDTEVAVTDDATQQVRSQVARWTSFVLRESRRGEREATIKLRTPPRIEMSDEP